MTLDEFIAYFEEQSKEHTNLVPYDIDERYNKNCRQLAKWLKELKAYRDARVGCEYCKHNYREQYERPCSLCQRNFMDMFEREVNADEE